VDGDDGAGDDGADEGGGEAGDAEPEVVGTTEEGSVAEVTALEWLVIAQDARSSHIIQTSTNRYRPAANPICHDDT
jgi:hypothetical protein